MAIDERLYLVRRKKDANDLGRLIVGSHPAQAIKHVALDELECTLPTALEAAELVRRGVMPERLNGPADPVGVPEPGDPIPDPPF